MQSILRPHRLIPVSLLLLFVAYLVVGWNWAIYRLMWTQAFWLLKLWPMAFWPGAGLVTMMTVALFTEPLAGVRGWVNRIFQSDTKMFFGGVALTSLSIFLLVHMEILAKVMLLLSAISLARFDFQLAKLRHWSAFFYLTGVALLGLYSGALLYWVWRYYQLPWLLDNLVI